MKKYIIRSLKYLLTLLVLISLLYIIIALTHIGDDRTIKEIFESQFLSSRGYFMIIALVLLSAAYPLFGYVKREMVAGFYEDRELIMRAMAASGYTIEKENDKSITFRASSLAKKIRYAFEDRIIISASGDRDNKFIVIEGVRRECVTIVFRLQGLMQNKTIE